jgi:hypothetical protein
MWLRLDGCLTVILVRVCLPLGCEIFFHLPFLATAPDSRNVHLDTLKDENGVQIPLNKVSSIIKLSYAMLDGVGWHSGREADWCLEPGRQSDPNASEHP